MTTKRTGTRSARIDGARLAKLRHNLGWTQVDLAATSGYCERVISKAEAGEPISFSTIRDLAESLSVDGQVIRPQDLIFSPIKLVEEFLSIMYQNRWKATEHEHHLLHPDFELQIGKLQSDSQAILFQDDLQIRQFFECFSKVIQPARPTEISSRFWFIATQDQVVAWGSLPLKMPEEKNLPLAPLVVHDFRISESSIIHLGIEFDSGLQCCLDEMLVSMNGILKMLPSCVIPAVTNAGKQQSQKDMVTALSTYVRAVSQP